MGRPFKGQWVPLKQPYPAGAALLPTASLQSFSGHVLMWALRSWQFYEIDIALAKGPSALGAESVLLGQGANLAKVLEFLPRAERETSERLSRLMGILVPGFERWLTELRSDGTVSFSIKEKGMRKPFPPSAISSGTIHLLALLAAVLHQPRPSRLVCIEEPERSVHPQVLKTLVEVVRGASTGNQIVMTTHSAELVRCLEPSEVLLVEKTDNQTVIVRAQDVEHIERFLEEFRLDELWLSGYLKGGTAL